MSNQIKPEHQEIIDILKFSPATYTIEISGYGGETYAGTVSRSSYRHFMDNDIDIDDYAGDWDNDMAIPDDLQPFSPGQQYECDNIFHNSGATMDDSTVLRVYNENNVEVFYTTLDTEALDAKGVKFEETEEVYVDDQPRGTIAVWGGHGEKGTFFVGKIDLKSPFKPENLKINYGDYDGWSMTNSVEYRGEEVDNDDYSTTGKWSEHRWVVVGGEEALETVAASTTAAEPTVVPDNYQGIPLTEWYSTSSYYPTRNGRYEVMVKTDQAWPFSTATDFARWNGSEWSMAGVLSWRGLTEKYQG